MSYIFGPSIRNQSNPKRQHLFSGGQRSGTDKWYLIVDSSRSFSPSFDRPRRKPCAVFVWTGSSSDAKFGHNHIRSEVDDRGAFKIAYFSASAETHVDNEPEISGSRALIFRNWKNPLGPGILEESILRRGLSLINIFHQLVSGFAFLFFSRHIRIFDGKAKPYFAAAAIAASTTLGSMG
ncbi:MAG TPA: hypothetical protein DCS07_06770 [Bdellovibrionales bacterium]|nr:hypothetical protein [Bdellovibrionales bacterium]HCM38923.1 hypothetical protein [Bdellovibrionales bacterium]